MRFFVNNVTTLSNSGIRRAKRAEKFWDFGPLKTRFVRGKRSKMGPFSGFKKTQALQILDLGKIGNNVTVFSFGEILAGSEP